MFYDILINTQSILYHIASSPIIFIELVFIASYALSSRGPVQLLYMIYQ